MGTISVSLPADGSTGTVSQYNTPLTTIVNAINGGLDNSNIASGAAIATSKLADDAGITNAKITNSTITASKLNLSPQTNTVATLETRANAAYGALTTAQAVTVTIGANGLAFVTIGAGQFYNNTINGVAYISYNMSGANTFAAADTKSINTIATSANRPIASGTTSFLLTGLTAGSTTFTLQFRSNGADVASFQDRVISVIPL